MNGENRWKGRVSATLFLEFSSQVDEYISLIKSHWPQSVLNRLDLHIVVAEMKVSKFSRQNVFSLNLDILSSFSRQK